MPIKSYLVHSASGLRDELIRTLSALHGCTNELTLDAFCPISSEPDYNDALAEGKACLPCHAAGGWAPSFGAYAPVVPHPELQSCWQCHVARTVTTVFERPPSPGPR